VFELTLRIVFSLLVVLGLMWGLARLARAPMRGRRGGMVTVLGRQQLSKGAAVAVVRVVDKALVVGVTDGQVTLLGEADLTAVEAYQEPTVRREAVSIDELTATASRPPQAFGALSTRDGALAGSVLSPRTWSQALRFLRERTAGRR
jgi:flagellar protein FliO/FliZ